MTTRREGAWSVRGLGEPACAGRGGLWNGYPQEVPLTATEFRILLYLASRPGRVFSRHQILAFALGPNTIVTDRSVDVHIRGIRKKLGEHRDLVETVRGIGDRFAEEPAVH